MSGIKPPEQFIMMDDEEVISFSHKIIGIER